MSKSMFSIDHHNITAVREHIAGEFKMKSWWPAEGPRQAEEEFEAMKHHPDTLADWCAKWLDGSQWRHLRDAVNRRSEPPQTS